MDNEKQKNKQQIILAVVIAVAMAAVGYVMFLRPAEAAYKTKLSEAAPVTSTQPTSTTATPVTANPETIRAAGIAIPSKPDIAGIQHGLESLASSKGVVISDFTVEKTSPSLSGVSQGIVIKVQARGIYPYLIPFLAAINSNATIDQQDQIHASGPLLMVTNLDLRPIGSNYQADLTIVVPTQG